MHAPSILLSKRWRTLSRALAFILPILLIPTLATAATTASDTYQTVLTPKEKAWVGAHEVVVGIEQWPPLVFTNPTGEPDGLSVDYLKLISERTGLRFSYTPNLWSYLLNGLKNREIDLLPATYYTDERATYGLYSTPYFQMREFFYIKEGRNEIQKSDYLREGTIAVVRDYGTIPKLKEAYPEATILETEDLLTAILAVLDGKADAVLDSQIAVEHELDTSAITGLRTIPITVFTPSPIHLFSRNDQPLLQSILQKGLDTTAHQNYVHNLPSKFPQVQI